MLIEGMVKIVIEAVEKVNPMKGEG